MFLACKERPKSATGKNDKRDTLMESIPSVKNFYEKKQKFNEVVEDLNKLPLVEKKNELKFFVPNQFEVQLKMKLKSLGVKRLLFYNDYCDSKSKHTFSFDFETNWLDDFPVHITMEPCSAENTSVDVHNFMENGNESWGLGEGWCIWYERTRTYNDTFPKYYQPN